MMNKQRSRETDISRGIKEHGFFNESPLKDHCFVTTISKFEGDDLALTCAKKLANGFPKGYIRLKNENDNVLYFYSEAPYDLKLLNLTDEQLKTYDEVIESQEKLAFLTPNALRSIHQLLGYAPEKEFFGQISLKEYIQSRGFVDDAPVSHFLAFSIKPLLKTNPALFNYLTPVQKKALRRELHTAFYQLCCQYQAEDIIHQRQHLRAYEADIERCASLLRDLELVEMEQGLKAHQKQALHDEAMLNKWYLKINQLYLDFSVGKTVYFMHWMNDLATWRSYFGWAGEVMRTALTFIPQDFYHVQQTKDIANRPQDFMRTLGCILYYVRFLVNFALILKHTLKGPWMSEEEKKLIDENGGTWNQFTKQLAAQKLSLINDFIWGTNCLVNILWLAKEEMGPYGSIVTMILLTVDFLLSNVAQKEAEQQHRQDIKFYDDEIKWLNRKIQEDSPSNTRARRIVDEETLILMEQLKRLEQAKNRCEAQWQLQLKGRAADLYHAAGIAVGFVVMVYPWVEIGAKASAQALVMGSTAFCFVVMLIYSGYKAYLEVMKAKNLTLSALEECHAILSSHGSLCEADYIRYNDLIAQAKYQEAMINHQYYVFVRTLIIQSIIPIAIFAGFTFATFGIGLVAFASVAAVSILTHYVIEALKPEEAAMTEFKKDEYDAFNREEELSRLNNDIKALAGDNLKSTETSHVSQKNDASEIHLPGTANQT